MESNINPSYIAGLFESTGNLSIKKDKRTKSSYYIHLVLKSKTENNLKSIKEQFGGKLIKINNRYNLILSHRKAYNLLNFIKDFLIDRKEEVEIALKLYQNRFNRKYEPERKKLILKEFLQKTVDKPKIAKEE
ncbi:hypothetical protein JCM14244_03910 [Venenivibrio stagnispumantis]|uniref:LAGLIDADG endonuclease n=1 Tax=Venenivibrio stagnispumantis TaxID=407998 RepID=A0AA46ADF7_9AQUI|nr:LAGLIDADG family homing endonuclease [Venenivibrio stagnispumantis]MCW4572970.1 hypothetical protein [Venenivibrio stagnispumantis]SMP05338.1 LAGLIDADG endonuclease [Venenivibrio stagnispumantis]